MTTILRGKQRRHLRGLGVHLQPVVFVGKKAITGGVLDEIRDALRAHELIKVRLLEAAGPDRKTIARELAERTESELVQVLGRTVLLYRRGEEEPRIEFPD